MKILIVIPYFYPANSFGGPVSVSFDIGKELVKRGHEIVVFTSDAKDLENRLDVEYNEVEGMHIFYFKNLSMAFVKWSNLFITCKLSSKLQSEIKSFDLIHLHEYSTYQNIIVHKFARKYNIPYIVQTHGSLPKVGRKLRKYVFDSLFGYRLLRDASRVLALSETESQYCKKMGVSIDKITILPNGINLSGNKNLSYKGLFKDKFNISDDKKIILYIGRLHKTKKINLLLEAYAYLYNNIKYTNTLLVIAGPDEGYLNELENMASSLKISNSVLFTGYLSQEDKINALTDSDVFVTPSFYGFPITFLEACRSGIPIVTTNFGDTLEWIDGKVGLVTPVTSTEIAKAIYSIITNIAEREKFSKNGIDIVRSKFSLENIVTNLEAIYLDILNSHSTNLI